jgi:hypothetical protein
MGAEEERAIEEERELLVTVRLLRQARRLAVPAG